MLSREARMSRGRTLLLDVGGILGTMAGGLVALMFDDAPGAGVGLTLGTSAGLALAFVATTGWDKPPPVNIAPTVIQGPDRRAGYGLTAGFSF
jgi:hypothetical protein